MRASGPDELAASATEDGPRREVGMTRGQRERALRELYALVPEMADCRGRCDDTCRSPYEVSRHERQRIQRRARQPLVAGDGCRACSMLTAAGRCRVYGDRPMICRVFGTAPALRCEHGCRPVQWLSDAQAVWLIVQSFNVGGFPGGQPPMDADHIAEIVRRNPGMLDEILRTLRAAPADSRPGAPAR